MDPSVYILKSDEHKVPGAIIQAVLNKIGEDLQSAVIGRFEETANIRVQKFENLSQYLMHLYRTLRLHKNERQIIYSEDDQLLATQLCIADYNKQKHDFYDVTTSEVLSTADHLIQDAINGDVTTSDGMSELTSKDEYKKVSRRYQEFLETCNSIDLATVLWNVKKEFLKSDETATHLSKLKCIVLQWPRNVVEASFLNLLCHTSRRYFKTTAEIPVSEDISELTPEKVVISTEEAVLPSCEDILVKSIPSNVTTPRVRTPAIQNLSSTEIYFKRVFLSYLTLVVNTRDELALARCFNVPDREMDHEAFTALKRESRQKDMPMCQTATSYVMKIRLGGKGYMPDSTCQIAQYVRGLSDFVSLIQKLQVIIEEERNPSSGLLRLINQIKVAFMKAKNLGCRKEIIEKVVRYLKLSVGKLSAGDNLETPQKSVGNGGSMAGAKTIKLLRKLLDQEASIVASRRSTDVLSDGMASQGTPVRLPSLISMFRSPAIPSPESPVNQSLAERLIQRENEQQVGMKRMGYRSCMMWADPKDLKDDQRVNKDYLRAIANESTQHSPLSEWKNTIWATEDDKNEMNGQKRSDNDEEILDMIDTIRIQEPSSNVENNVTAGDTPKGRGKLKRQPFRDISEQSKMKKAKNDKPKAKSNKPNAKKNKAIQQVKGQKKLSSFFRV